MNTNEDRQNRSAHGGVRFLALIIITVVATAIIAIALLVSTHSINVESDALQRTNERYAESQIAIDDLLDASSYLTTQSRLFSSTYHTTYLDNYFWELSRSEQRKADAEVLRRNYPGTDATEYFDAALAFSENLSKKELYSMKLVVSALDLEIDENIANMLDEISFTRGDDALSSEKMLEKAHMLVTYEPYEHDVDRVSQHVDKCKAELANLLESEKQLHEKTLSDLFLRQQVLTCILLAMILFSGITFIVTVSKPIAEYIGRIKHNERLEEKGAYEMRFLAGAYNEMYDDNQRVRKRLTYEAAHDSLTGLNNRGSFDCDIATHQRSPMALVILDIDHFKEVNDQHGHDIGDIVLKEMAASLEKSFEPDGTAYRLGGDEFVVIMPGTAEELRDSIERRARAVAAELARPHGEAPAVGVSAGVAFGDGTQASDDYYKRADKALYRVKGESGQGIAFDDEPGIRPFWD